MKCPVADGFPGCPPRCCPPRLPSALGCLAAWQAFVVIPSLRWAGTPQALSPIVLRAAARGEEQALVIRRDQAMSLLSLDVNSADPGAPLTYEVIAPGGAVRHKGATQAPPAGSPLIVVLPNSAIREPGAWVLLLRNAAGRRDRTLPVLRANQLRNSMDNLHPRRHVFHGHASGVAAHIRRPEARLLPVQGCSTLPVTGGLSESNVGPANAGQVGLLRRRVHQRPRRLRRCRGGGGHDTRRDRLRCRAHRDAR